MPSTPDAPVRSRALLSGWGRAAASASDVVDVDEDELPAAIKALPPRGGIARGLGRSYGDPAQNAGGTVVRLAPTLDDVAVDDAACTATVGAGVSIDDLLSLLVPRGYFVPVTPGTRFVTIGGAVASDIHGKNHLSDGSFGQHITRLRLMLADTTVVEIGPDRDPELFWATIGGMGLTGMILDATFRLIPIETSRFVVDTHRFGHLDDLLVYLSESEQRFKYSVAWIDLLATGKHLGRGVVTNGDHATLSDVGSNLATDPLAYRSDQVVSVPPLVPSPGLVNRLSATAFNELWYRKAPRSRLGEIQNLHSYFYPLDLVGSWNRVYGRRGFLQYQFAVPPEAIGVVRAVIEQISAASLPICLTVLKRFGPSNPAPLSFPIGGWTLAIDVPTGRRGLSQLLHGFDRMILDAGGRHYLAKDFQTSPEALRVGYPRLGEWLATRERVDPTGVWASDLSRRLGLTPT